MHIFWIWQNFEKILLKILALLTIISLPQARAKPYYRDPFASMRCTDELSGRELLVGDAFTRPGHCVRVQCLGNLNIWEDRCQVPQLEGNCTRLPPANEYLDYPKCCPLYQCHLYQTSKAGETKETRTFDHYGNLKRTHITQIFVITQPMEDGHPVPGNGIKTQFEI